MPERSQIVFIIILAVLFALLYEITNEWIIKKKNKRKTNNPEFQEELTKRLEHAEDTFRNLTIQLEKIKNIYGQEMEEFEQMNQKIKELKAFEKKSQTEAERDMLREELKKEGIKSFLQSFFFCLLGALLSWLL